MYLELQTSSAFSEKSLDLSVFLNYSRLFSWRSNSDLVINNAIAQREYFLLQVHFLQG